MSKDVDERSSDLKIGGKNSAFILGILGTYIELVGSAMAELGGVFILGKRELNAVLSNVVSSTPLSVCGALSLSESTSCPKRLTFPSS
jgi:hypothetical protein